VNNQTYENQNPLCVDETFATLETYIEGPLRQIEAARKALHSPSLNARKRSNLERAGSGASDMRKYASGVAGSDQAKGPVSRKCISRAQMAEPYELSQDLLDKQMEVLGNKYGGSGVANTAANTIQRAYRRYTMDKKFKAITSAACVKTENRLSRRFANMIGGGGGGESQMEYTSGVSHSHMMEKEGGHMMHRQCCAYTSTTNTTSQHKTSYPGLPKVSVYSTDQQQTRSVSNVTRPNPEQFHHLPLHHQDSRLPPSCASSHVHSTPPPGGGGPTPAPHHDCHTVNCPSRAGQWGHHTPHNHIGVRPGPSFEDEENSDADIQSFPVDYLPDRSALTCMNQRLSGRQLSTGRMVGPSHAHCANCGSGQALPSHHSHRLQNCRKRAPDVPKRTVSRLTSLDVGESSELYPARSSDNSRTSSTQSSPRIGVADIPPRHQHEPKLLSTDHSPNISRDLHPSSRDTNYQQQQQQRDINRNQVRAGGQDRVDAALHSQNNIPSRSKDAYPGNYAVNEVIRKRHYRTGLNIFNKKPEKGIGYLISKGFLDNSPAAVARFLITRKGLSKQMIGEYLGNISNQFNMAVLNCFANEIDLAGAQIDNALRKFQTYFRMPGEAQKIERLMEVFSQRYCNCNPGVLSKLNSADTIFILAFAIILLNTDLHTPSLKPEKKMKPEDFVRNLRGIDGGADVDREVLMGVYERIRNTEFKPGSDHVTQVMKVQQTIVVKCPNLSVPYRRLVCYCRLYEVQDKNKKDRPGQHQREVFLFNDILVITKIHSRRKNSVTYTFRNSFPLTGMLVSLFENAHYSHGITLTQKWDRKVVITLNARNDHDRSKFVEDLRESVAEMDEMESLRIEAELEKQHATARVSVSSDNRDSGVNDCDSHDTAVSRVRYGLADKGGGGGGNNLKRSAINNSLLDLTENNHNILAYPVYNNQEKPVRRGSVGSLDSGMSISFQSGSAGSAGTVSQDSSPQQQLAAKNGGNGVQHHINTASAGLRPRKLSSNLSTNL